jgi:nickel/cobalt exporter
MIADFVSATIMTTGFAVAFFHAALPTHWLPFVLASRGQGWSKLKSLFVTILSGLAHAGFTALLGVLIVFVGVKTENWDEHVFHVGAGLILLAFGAYYLLRQAKGVHGHCCHSHNHQMLAATARSDRAVIFGLLAMLAASPCEGFLPVYLSSIHYGWIGFAALTAVLAIATASGMAFFTWLALIGWERMRLKALEHYESLILGILLCLLGIIVITFEH